MRAIIVFLSLCCFCQSTFAQVQKKVTVIDSVRVLTPRQTKEIVIRNIKPFAVTDSVPVPTSKQLKEVVIRRTKPFAVTDTVPVRMSKQLEEVVIRSTKPLFQQVAGGIAVNVQSSLITKGSSVLQVLERSPGVVIDPRNNTIALNGKTGVMVMLDGKLIRLSIAQVVDLLNNMNADNIDKIELLSTPSANYDADGNAGLINIVTRKFKQRGISGSLNMNGGYGKGEKAGLSMNLIYNRSKINWYGSYAYTHEKAFGEMLAEGTENVLAVGGPTTFRYLGTSEPLANYHNAIAGFNTELSPKVIIDGTFNYTNSRNYSHHLNRGQYIMKPDSILLFNSVINGISSSQNLISSLSMAKMIRKGEKIGLGLDYIIYRSNGNRAVRSSFVDNHGNPAGTTDSLYAPLQRNFASTDISVKVAKLDYSKQLNSKWKLDLGMKGTYTRNKGMSGIENLVGDQWKSPLKDQGNLLIRETIGAAYGSLNIQLDTLISLMVGVRYEYSNNHSITLKRNLSKLFPNILFSKKLNGDKELQLSYSRRISRPSYNDLTSYITYNDPVSVFTGNPLLKPVLTSNVKFVYNYRSYSFSFLASRDSNPIVQGQVVSGPSKQLVYISPQNISWQNNLIFQANVPIEIADWWKMSFNLLGGWRKFRLDYTLIPVEKTYYSHTLNYNQSFTLPKQFSLELSGYYNSLSYYGAQQIKGMGTLNMGIKKELRNNKGSFQLSVADVFGSLTYRSNIGKLTRDAFDSKVDLRYSSETSRFPIFRIIYSRSFGSNSGTNERPESGVKDERQRIGT